MKRSQSHALKYLLLFIGCFVFGSLVANQLVTYLNVSIHADRQFFSQEIQQALKANNPENRSIQNAIYQQRIAYLKNQTEELTQKKAAVEEYLVPLQKQVTDYRMAFSEKTQQSFDERLDLYIELVKKHNQFENAKRNEQFIPLIESDSLFSLPSIHNDLITQQGGALAQAHNEFITEPRNASIAANYEPSMRSFFSQQKISNVKLECHTSICAVHLGHQWQEPYYDGMAYLKDQLQLQPWFNLTPYQSKHEYRGNGRHIGVWYFKVAQ
ncbi:hypothetical protein KO489_14090 [Reinekea forsetii]|nr:hypothetical protein [Reinekea forsetii]